MYKRSGYLNDKNEAIVFTDRALGVCSCGHYRMDAADSFMTTRPDGRPDWQLIFAPDGGIRALIDKKEIALDPFSFVLFEPGTEQIYYLPPGERSQMYFVHFSGVGVKNILEELGLYKKKLIENIDDPACSTVFEKIITELQRKAPFFFELSEALLRELLCRISRKLSQNAAPVKTEQVSEAVIYINDHYSEPSCITNFTRRVSVSRSHFCRIFRAQTGQTPTGYLKNVRMNAAKELLVSTDLFIGEIADRVGYQDALYFSKLFCRSAGVSPSEYRKKIKGTKK
ncbi:MAG: helix-turn-helix transcriptional regulator [Clostridia bacterium]|nr:helix-turn-helix transcriptional regulator [Clostridia bacterium]